MRNIALVGTVLCVALAVWWVIVCTPEQTPFQIEDNARAGFSGFPGMIGVTLIEFGGERHRFAIRNGEVAAIDDLPSAIPTTTAQGAEFRKRISPVVDGYRDEGPFAQAPDERFVATALSPKTQTFPPNSAVRVVDSSINQTLFVFDDGNRWIVHALAWAPDSSAVAVIRVQYTRRYCFMDMIMAMSGHPAYTKTHHLLILGRDGRVLANTTLMKGAVTKRLELVWLD